MDTRHVDQALATLGAHKTQWARLPIRDKIGYLKQIRQLALTHAQRWADAETKAKQLTPGSPLVGAEAWLGGPYGLVAWLTASMRTLATLEDGGDLLAHVKTRRRADGRVVARVLPADGYERLLFHPIFEDIFAPLIHGGYLAFVYGGGDVGEYLIHHDAVQAIHITGSAATHDLIVYGPGQDGQRRKAADDRILGKPITSELGGVGGTIVLPGPWTEADFRYQAQHVVTQKLHNSGHNCVASQVFILPADWNGHDTMLSQVRRELHQAEARTAYYPGTEQRLAALQHAAPDAEILGSKAKRLLVADADIAGDHYGFRTEFFGPAMMTTSLPGDAGQFLRRAVEFCNDRLYGTLSVNIIVHPATRAQLGEDFDRAIAGLRYGAIGINAWAGAAFLLPRAAWGAYPGHTYTDVQSGIGVVHNALMFDKPLKTVVSAPFRPFPRSVRHGELTIFPKPKFRKAR